MKKELISDLLYNTEDEEVNHYLTQSTDDEELYVFAYNYTWGGGFDIPTTIINNPCCSLSTALLVFYRADGYSFLMDKEADKDLLPWHTFISELYTRIITGYYKANNVSFNPPLTKVQVFKLRKRLTQGEEVLITPIDGHNCDMDL